MKELKITLKSKEGVDLVAVSGPLDSLNLPKFQELLIRLTSHRPTKAIVDCRQVTYMNVKAIRLVYHYHRSALHGMGALAFVGLKADLLRYYKSMHLLPEGIFDSSIDEALAELKPLLAA